MKLEFSASVGFIHKESVTMHGHTIVKAELVFYFLLTTTHCIKIVIFLDVMPCSLV